MNQVGPAQPGIRVVGAKQRGPGVASTLGPLLALRGLQPEVLADPIVLLTGDFAAGVALIQNLTRFRAASDGGPESPFVPAKYPLDEPSRPEDQQAPEQQ